MNLIEKNHLITTLENITTLVKTGEVISLVISFNTIDDNIMTFWSSSNY